MRFRRTDISVSVEMTLGEAQVLLDELSDIPGGARLKKMRQVCDGLAKSLALTVPAPVKVLPRAAVKVEGEAT